jgi:hypothetical protein
MMTDLKHHPLQWIHEAGHWVGLPNVIQGHLCDWFDSRRAASGTEMTGKDDMSGDNDD